MLFGIGKYRTYSSTIRHSDIGIAQVSDKCRRINRILWTTGDTFRGGNSVGDGEGKLDEIMTRHNIPSFATQKKTHKLKNYAKRERVVRGL